MTDTNHPHEPFPPLDTGCKQAFPFTLACPSFVYPAGYVENVRHLAPAVDEIQLLFFESRSAQSLPSQRLVRELAELADDKALTYSVHLPTDIYLGHTDKVVRRRAVDVVRQVMDRCERLAPSTYTMHLSRNPGDRWDLPAAEWQLHLIDALTQVTLSGVDSRRLSVETLYYPFAWVASVIADMDLSVCMDMGHLMAHGADLMPFYDCWRKRVTTIHLHGVDQAGDHQPLDRLSRQRMDVVLAILRQFTGVVCLEVYSHPGLNASLGHLLHQWRHRTGRRFEK
jgi:sugar phosphate isomerase/epimerase